ncbi:hypothetical protein [Novipirellula caenicola]|uniref:HEAT repeat protein n=1 Tax=Novipirellula caenicola TaxID=1536901 RepID=A0ABP9VPB6_9BACT
MRLTLRTLLAYLDNTLDPTDAESLRVKVAESSFAGQLVQRIRTNLAKPNLSAPAPDAVGPIEEANVISEYLDSTLSAEQISEIERACLESDQQLAEAAACHQILTLVLGKTAEVSPELRQRIYALPDRDIADLATAGSFSSVALPDAEPTQVSPQPVSDIEVPTGDQQSELDAIHEAATQSNTAHPGGVVQPVGPGDSGVSDAPTRIRQSDALEVRRRDAMMHTGRPRSALEAAQMYGGSIRTSRIAPWLVSLALAAVLLFALVRIFEPLVNRSTVADADLGPTWTDLQTDDSPSPVEPITEPSKEIEVSASDAPAMVPVGTPGREMTPDAESRSGTSPTENLPASSTLPAPVGNATPEAPSAESDPMAPPAPASVGTDSRPGGTSEVMPPPKPQIDSETSVKSDSPIKPDSEVKSDATAGVTGSPSSPAPRSDVDIPAVTELPAGESPAVADSATDSTAGDSPSETMAADPDGGAPPTVEEISDPKVPAADTAKAAKVAVAKVTTDTALVFAIGDDETPVQINKDDVIQTQQSIVCAPTYRVRIDTVDDMAVTLVGPAKVQWTRDGSEKPLLHVDHGRILLEAIKPGASIDVRINGKSLTLKFPGIESLVAMTMVHFRAPGFDPLKKENHINTVGVFVAQGSVGLSDGENTTDLATGQRWVQRGDEPAVTSESKTPLDWIIPPDPNDQSLESSAREALLGLMIPDQPVEISLREATMFRRSEAGALAARTLLALGRPDVFFGGDGMLSQADQRSYWSDHYVALQNAIDRDASTAEQVKQAIERMDQGNAKTLFQLLVGFSQKQLEEGADALLVRSLDSPSMSVRALALENLRKITGVTLSFRPEQDNAARRGQAIKKWEARQRKGDIRWATP